VTSLVLAPGIDQGPHGREPRPQGGWFADTYTGGQAMSNTDVAVETTSDAARFPHPAEEILLAHFIVSDDVERSRRFYTQVLVGSFRQDWSMIEPSTVRSQSPCSAIPRARGATPRTLRCGSSSGATATNSTGALFSLA
jgi:hypothetical protein